MGLGVSCRGSRGSSTPSSRCPRWLSVGRPWASSVTLHPTGSREASVLPEPLESVTVTTEGSLMFHLAHQKVKAQK